MASNILGEFHIISDICQSKTVDYKIIDGVLYRQESSTSPFSFWDETTKKWVLFSEEYDSSSYQAVYPIKYYEYNDEIYGLQYSSGSVYFKLFDKNNSTYGDSLFSGYYIYNLIGGQDNYVYLSGSYYSSSIIRYDIDDKTISTVSISNITNLNNMSYYHQYSKDTIVLHNNYFYYVVNNILYRINVIDMFDGNILEEEIANLSAYTMSGCTLCLLQDNIHIFPILTNLTCSKLNSSYRFVYSTTEEKLYTIQDMSIKRLQNNFTLYEYGQETEKDMFIIPYVIGNCIHLTWSILYDSPTASHYIIQIDEATTEKIMYVTNTGEAWYGGGINVNNNFIVDKDGNVTLPPGTTISWSDVQGTENIATSDDISSTKDTIMTEIGDTYVKTTEIEANIAHLGGWTIAKNGLISPDFGDYTTGTSGLALYSDGNILNRGLWTGQDNAWYAYLYRGKWIFGLGNYFGATANEQYSDISANGIYMCSKDTILNNSSQYLFAVDTTNDTVAITNSSNTSPALTITNNYYDTDNSNYDAPALVLHSPYQGYRNRPLDVRMKVTGEILGTGQTVDNEYCMQMFGEQEYGRIIFRSSKIVGTVNDDGTVTYAPEGNTADTESSDPLVPSMIGSSTFRWFQGYFMELYSTNGLNTSSDKKIKNHIQDIDTSKSLELVNSLTPVEYTLKNNANGRKHMGFYAQDVKKICDDMELGNMSLYAATWHKDGQEQECYYSEDAPDEELQWTLKYEEFIAPLVGAVQALTKRVDDLEADNEKLRTRIEKLEDASE